MMMMVMMMMMVTMMIMIKLDEEPIRYGYYAEKPD